MVMAEHDWGGLRQVRGEDTRSARHLVRYHEREVETRRLDTARNAGGAKPARSRDSAVHRFELTAEGR
jgi:hypothetical protein